MGFSSSSRRRFQAELASVCWDDFPVYFITLTYRDDWPSELEQYPQLDAWIKRLRRYYGAHVIGGYHRKEFKTRRSGDLAGFIAPHFHVIMFFDVDLPASALVRRLSRAWNDIVAPGDAEHLSHGCHVKRVYNTSGSSISKLMVYVSKYMAKVEGTEFPTGRLWGKFGNPPKTFQGFSLSASDYATFCRRLRRYRRDSGYLRHCSALWRGFLVFGDGYAMLDLMRGLESFKFGVGWADLELGTASGP